LGTQRLILQEAGGAVRGSNTGVVTDYDYDGLNRLKHELVTNSNDKPLFEQDYALLDNGQRAQPLSFSSGSPAPRVPGAIAGGGYTTTRLTAHAMTNIQAIQPFRDVEMETRKVSPKIARVGVGR
jgi:hypothetical protein